MRQGRLGTAVVWAFALVLVNTAARAQETKAAASNSNIEEKAMTVLKRSADFLSQAQRFSVTMDMGFDVVQISGQKIEFGETRKIVLRRPDHLRVDETKRDGSQSGLRFDGKDLTVFHVKENVYATVVKPGTVDQAIAYFINDLDMRLPLAQLLSSNLAKVIPAQVRVADYVEEASIAGVPCDHIAIRGDLEDMQLWVAQGKQPLPQRIVVTYRREDGRPQFWAQFSEWNLSPEAPDSLFTFTSAAGARKIAFSPRQMLQPRAVETKGGQ